jgi:hypothetical protein
MDNIPYRSSDFYYIEIYTTNQVRLKKINSILDEKKKTKPKYYYNGLHGKVDPQKKIYNALFWKTIDGVTKRTLSIRNNYPNFHFVIKCMNRKEFLNIIPKKPSEVSDIHRYYFRRNHKIAMEEIRYMDILNGKNE